MCGIGCVCWGFSGKVRAIERWGDGCSDGLQDSSPISKFVRRGGGNRFLSITRLHPSFISRIGPPELWQVNKTLLLDDG